MSEARHRYVSSDRRVREDRRFVVGKGKFVADIDLPNAEESVRLAGAPQGQAKAVACNVADPAQVDALVDAIAKARGQSLAQMAIAWVLRDKRMTSALIGASSAEQIVELVGALKQLSFSAEELAAIDQHAIDGGINLWQKPSTDQALT